jgi:hypothetical protein
MKTLTKEKPRIVPVTDPAEIASIERNGAGDILGARWPDGAYYAYAHSVEKYRRQRSRECGKHE